METFAPVKEPYDANVLAFFMYGTFRQDCADKMMWKEQFYQNCSSLGKPIRAHLHGFKLYWDTYPVVCKTGDDNDYAIGEVVVFDKEYMPGKIMSCDYVEGHPDFYQRIIVDAVTLDEHGIETNEKTKCYCYTRNYSTLTPRHSQIDSRCWITFQGTDAYKNRPQQCAHQ
jgi:gamma-glutamylcyclotransferase (GGCT)/AIG2-like uncharacterized protein YtfP